MTKLRQPAQTSTSSDPLSGLISIIRLLYQAYDAVPDDSISVSGLSKEQALLAKVIHRRVVRKIRNGFLFICLILPILLNLYIHFFDHAAGAKDVTKYTLPWNLTPINLIMGLAMGFGLGMRQLPVWYLHTPLGLQWEKLAGVNSVRGLIIVSRCLYFFGIGYALLVGWLTISKS